jgi:hypothetical protein
MKRVGLLLVIGVLAGAVVAESGASAAPLARAAKKCKKHSAKKKHKKCHRKKGSGRGQPGALPPAPNATTGGTLAISPSSWNFGATPIGLPGPQQQFVVRNQGSSASGPLGVAITGPGAAAFQDLGGNCPGNALDPGSQCSVFIACVGSGTVPASFSASLSVSANPGGGREAALTCSQF